MDVLCMSLTSMVPSFSNTVKHRCHVWLCPHLSLLLLAALVCSCLTGEEAAPPPAPLLPPGDTALGSPLLGSVLTQAHVTMYTCRVWTGAGCYLDSSSFMGAKDIFGSVPLVCDCPLEE